MWAVARADPVYVTTANLVGAAISRQSAETTQPPTELPAAEPHCDLLRKPPPLHRLQLGFSAGGTVTNPGNGGLSGSVGTVAFFDTSATNNNLNVYQNFPIAANANVTYNAITVRNAGILTIGGGATVNVTTAITVTANSSIVLQSINNAAQVNGAWAGAGVTLNAATVQVDAGSSINADGQGYQTQAGPGAAGQGTTTGGSYGGTGSGPNPAPVYGSPTAPTDLGSGGGQYQGTGTPGGGAVRLVVSGTLTNNGIISANAAAANGFTGGSAGGSVYVTTQTLAGAGTFNANAAATPVPMDTAEAADASPSTSSTPQILPDSTPPPRPRRRRTE